MCYLFYLETSKTYKVRTDFVCFASFSKEIPRATKRHTKKRCKGVFKPKLKKTMFYVLFNMVDITELNMHLFDLQFSATFLVTLSYHYETSFSLDEKL